MSRAKTATKGKSSSSSPASNSRTAIPPLTEKAILAGIQTEVDRTLPFWRCFLDVRAAHRHTPVVMERVTTITARRPCSAFPGVEAVWATSLVQLRVQTDVAPAHATLGDKRARDGDSGKGSGTRAATPKAEKTRRRYWLEIPHRDVWCRLGTLHFVHRGAGKRGTAEYDRSFHVQSTICHESPAVLQCVAGTMINFSFVVYTALRLLQRRARQGAQKGGPLATSPSITELVEEQEAGGSTQRDSWVAHATLGPDDFAPSLSSCITDAVQQFSEQSAAHPSLQLLCPPPTMRICVLGMGGNSMAVALRCLLGPLAALDVVEMEPAVVEVCRDAGTALEKDPNHRIHVTTAAAFLEQAAAESKLYDMIFMDVFEPVNGTMRNCPVLVHAAYQCVAEGGLVVINDHELPSVDSLHPFVQLFGAANLQAVNLRGWRESVIVGVRASKEAPEGGLANLLLSFNKPMATQVEELYARVLPGWMPPLGWLRRSMLVGKGTERCRVFES